MAGDELPRDRNGNFHDENGRFVSLRDFFNSLLHEREKQMERVFAERETSAEFKRLALKDALDEQKLTTATALAKQEETTKQKLEDAKAAADEVVAGIQREIETLKSGGAPFASRLDEGLTKLRSDVDTLNTDAVRTKVLDALREQQAVDSKNQRKQIRAALIAAALSFVFSAILVAVQVLSK